MRGGTGLAVVWSLWGGVGAASGWGQGARGWPGMGGRQGGLAEAPRIRRAGGSGSRIGEAASGDSADTMGCCSGRCTLIFLCTFQLVSGDFSGPTVPARGGGAGGRGGSRWGRLGPAGFWGRSSPRSGKGRELTSCVTPIAPSANLECPAGYVRWWGRGTVAGTGAARTGAGEQLEGTQEEQKPSGGAPGPCSDRRLGRGASFGAEEPGPRTSRVVTARSGRGAVARGILACRNARVAPNVSAGTVGLCVRARSLSEASARHRVSGGPFLRPDSLGLGCACEFSSR